MSYRAIVVETAPASEGTPQATVRELSEAAVPLAEGIRVDVSHSSVNYKDAIALTGGPGILRTTPMVPGIDAVGTLAEPCGELPAGTLITLNGAGLGERTDGGLAESALVPASAVVAVPSSFAARDAAAIGTAGFTAALSVLALQRQGVAPEAGEVLVTGAGGGVGSFAIALLASLGYRVVAATGRVESRGPALTALGAAEVLDRAALAEAGKPLQKGRWAAVVDSVGGIPLANALAQTMSGGVVTAAGLAADSKLPTTVLPFILRAVTLVGINSVEAPPGDRGEAWTLLATHLDGGRIADIAPRTVPLAEASSVGAEVLAGTVAGRVVVDVRA